jgi:hypothetical protein
VPGIPMYALFLHEGYYTRTKTGMGITDSSPLS